ncbi:deoxyribodipyrimidine photo-lyase [soil metagenome]
MTGSSIVWLRDDLRIADNPALRAGVDRATAAGAGVVVLYLLDEVSPGIRPLGAAARWWLHCSLTALGEELERHGARLLLRRGAAETELPRLVRETGAEAVFWNRRYAASREVDARLKSSMREAGVTVESFAANLLVEPWTVTTAGGKPYRVFTPFWRAAQERPIREPVAAPLEIPGFEGTLAGDELDDWGLSPTRPDWAGGLREAWTPGEVSAHRRLEAFVTEPLADYHRRDEPGVDATSRLSPHLRFGELSPVQIWHRVQHGELTPAGRRNAPKFLSEVGWREFNWNILFHSPDLATKNFRPEFDAFPWDQQSPDDLAAWQQGRTGIPLVDAGMRELWTTGVMHNRVRMVAASLLVKNLLVDWRVGEQWFWDTLVDADEASNPANWQWVAGSGADAAPYFRVFNPELQAAKFDPDGVYLDRWVPERLSAEYPAPIVDLAQSRREALSAYQIVTGSR